MLEVWKDIQGYNGKYQVSNLGRVKSLNYKRTGKEHILALALSSYPRLNLRKNGKTVNCAVHRLVWEAFNGPIPVGLQINHLNENKSDNRLANLSLVTPSQNINWGTRTERMRQTQRRCKKNIKVILQYDLNENFIVEYYSLSEAARQIGNEKARYNIANCARGKVKSSYGYIWKYKD